MTTVETVWTYRGGHAPTYFDARVVLDGRVTSWSCNHNHHTPEAAEKCLAKLLRMAQQWFAAGEPYEVTIPRSGSRPIFEMRLGATTRRFSYLDDD